jgi:hypothetical protein
MTKPLHIINYEGKRYEIPFDLDLNVDKNETIKVDNRFGFGSETLPWFAVAVYDLIMGAEMLDDYNTMQEGLSWFRQYFPKQYMTLLD